MSEKGLNGHEQILVDIFSINPAANRQEAGEAAGYSHKYARAQCTRALNRARVKRAILARRREMVLERGIDLAGVKVALWEFSQDDSKTPTAQGNALKELSVICRAEELVDAAPSEAAEKDHQKIADEVEVSFGEEDVSTAN